MRNTYPQIVKKNFKFFSLVFLLFTSNMMACKSSLEEDLKPEQIGRVAEADIVSTTKLTGVNIQNATLKGSFSFPIGAAVVKEFLDDPSYSQTLKRDFSRLSSESNFKFYALHPAIDRYTFAKADAIVSFAEQNNMKVHGHTLIWGKDEPTWLKNFHGDKAAWENLLRDHITTVLTHFKGKVESWDVVNEAIADNGTFKDCIWYRKLGPDYVLKAFQYAHEADPSVKLFINDYGQEFGGKKMNTLLSLIDQARAKNITIDGMGFQLHTVLRIEVPKITNSFALAAKKGLLVHISEMDVSVRYQKPAMFDFTDELDQKQGEVIKGIVMGYLSVVPKNLQFGITTWGVSDKTSFFNKGYANSDHDYPLLFDKNYKPKQAYRGFLEAGLSQGTALPAPASAAPASPAAPIVSKPVANVENTSRRTLRSAFDFPIGAAVVKEMLENPLYGKTVGTNFSRVSSENNFKLSSLHPEKDRYTFEKADAIVAFAQQNNMKVHGNTLVWSRDTPKWLVNYKGDKAAWEKLLKDHITTVLHHFAGKVQSWDVVNEAIADNGSYKDCIWYRKLGADYVLKAFQYAHEADPGVKLFLNDYGQEFGGRKMNTLLSIIDQAKAKKIKIDGMGFQLRTVLRITVPNITKNLSLAANKGLLIHISEMEVSVKYQKPAAFDLNNELAAQQGEKIKAIVKGYMAAVPKNQQFGITTWGVSDKTAFANKGYANCDHDYPLLFDKNYAPKPAYQGFLDAGLGR